MAERPEDLNLPPSVVTKIIKDCLPPGCKVSKEANAAIVKAASVFVLYTTSTANGVAQNGKRKTITGPDVIKAMTEIEFDKFVRPLENSLSAFRKGQQDKKDTAAKKKAQAATSKDTKEKEDEEMEVEEVTEVEEVKEDKPAEEDEDDDEVTVVEATADANPKGDGET